MNENQRSSNEGVFVEVGRSLGHSRSGRLFVAFAVAALFCGLAAVAWHARDLAATVLTVGLLVYGVQLAWRLLPISRVTRERWVRERQIADRCPACQWRGLLWAGIGIGIANFCPSNPTKPVGYLELLVPGVLVVAGSISYLLCQRFLRNERNS